MKEFGMLLHWKQNNHVDRSLNLATQAEHSRLHIRQPSVLANYIGEKDFPILLTTIQRYSLDTVKEHYGTSSLFPWTVIDPIIDMPRMMARVISLRQPQIT